MALGRGAGEAFAMTAYYNEFDPQAAAWLRVLIAEGHIAPGVVDERSIEDVRPSDLDGFAQCHFFAGIGVWSYALRRAGWRDDRPIWTGSCPCQPFSAAGKGAGFDDERHLWPAFQWLIQECKPECVVGEQVASAAVDDWIDLVHADMEALGYAFGSVPFPAAGVGAPHIRDRNYWVAHANNSGRVGRRPSEASNGRDTARQQSERLCDVSGMGNASGQGLDERERERGILGGAVGTVKGQAAIGAGIYSGGLADTDCGQRDGVSVIRRFERYWQDTGWSQSSGQPGACSEDGWPGPTNGYWRDADWLGCTDGKFRPVEPGTFPLVTGAAARVVRLRGYGNAVNAEQARAWIETVMECLPC